MRSTNLLTYLLTYLHYLGKFTRKFKRPARPLHIVEIHPYSLRDDDVACFNGTCEYWLCYVKSLCFVDGLGWVMNIQMLVG